MFNTPILFLIFNRLDTTRQVLAQIKKIQPAQLFIAADGPRPDKEGEKDKCNEVRQWVLDQIDWDCEVKTLFRKENLGCGRGPATAIDWFFENVDRGIILEDDCVPNNSFFVFCETMLKRFENDSRIMHISGNNFQLSQIGTGSFYLSKFPHSWGWATWKRAWQKFDFELAAFNDAKRVSYFDNKEIDDYWHNMFKMTKDKCMQVWDYQWVFTVFSNNGFSIIPQYNLVSNIGFGEHSTHTSDKENDLANMKRYEMEIGPGDAILNYDPIPDISLKKYYRGEVTETPAASITAIGAIKILINKVKFRISKAFK